MPVATKIREIEKPNLPPLSESGSIYSENFHYTYLKHFNSFAYKFNIFKKTKVSLMRLYSI